MEVDFQTTNLLDVMFRSPLTQCLTLEMGTDTVIILEGTLRQREMDLVPWEQLS